MCLGLAVTARGLWVGERGGMDGEADLEGRWGVEGPTKRRWRARNESGRELAGGGAAPFSRVVGVGGWEGGRVNVLWVRVTAEDCTVWSS